MDDNKDFKNIPHAGFIPLYIIKDKSDMETSNIKREFSTANKVGVSVKSILNQKRSINRGQFTHN